MAFDPLLERFALPYILFLVTISSFQVAFDPLLERFAVGAADGRVRVYDSEGIRSST